MNVSLNTPLPVALTVGGFDPSAGAGVLADLKTFAAHQCYGVSAVTSLTVQTTQGVHSSHAVDPKILRETLESLLADISIRATKVGMLGGVSQVKTVAEFLWRRDVSSVVLDPVMKSSSGADLLDADGLIALKEKLLPIADVVTPNLDEAARLTGLPVNDVAGRKTAARQLVEMGSKAVVVTGGHLEKPVDVFFDGQQMECFSGDRVKSENSHGTGCTFASAVAANLALGYQVRDAVMLAKAYVTESLRKAYPVGQGSVPLNHFYRMQPAQRPVIIEEPVREPIP